VDHVLDPDHGHAARLDAPDERHQLGRLGLGEPARDLVEEEQRGAGGQRAAQLQALAVEESQRARPPVGFLREPGALEDLSADGRGGTLTLATAEAGGHEQVLVHRHAAEGMRDLIGAADAAPAALMRGEPRDVLAPEANGPRVRADVAADQVEDGGLPGAVGADDAQHLAGAHRQRDAVRGPDGAERLGDPLERQNLRHGDKRPSRRERPISRAASACRQEAPRARCGCPPPPARTCTSCRAPTVPRPAASASRS
jgi:hypothetical protein